MTASSVAKGVAWPFAALAKALATLGRWMWYMVIAGSPPLMAIWMMKHVDHHKDREEEL